VKFNTHAIVRGDPQFTLRAKPGPFKVEADAEGRLKIACGRIDARLSRVPISMRIPFLKRSHSVQIASVGPCTLRIQPIEVGIDALAVHVAGVLAKDGMDCEVSGKVACNMDVDLSGSIPGRITKAAIEMAADHDSAE
jgi:hypothetical protein